VNGTVFMTFPVTATSHSLADYRARGGYAGLEKALREYTPAQVGERAKASGLQGRGGAGFMTGLKWEFVSKEAPVVYLCCNIDEGEPGTFKDRWILEHSPHQLIEGMLIASYALRVRHAFAYIRGEFDLPLRRLQAALQEAQAAGLVGENVLGSGFSCDIVVHRGAGAYVCGEESSLINSLEGKKGFPRNKPPFPAVRGLYQKPTVVNNVETLANLVNILRDGAAAFKSHGTPKNPGTRLISISGHIAKPGVYEIEIGYPWRTFLEEDCGGMMNDANLKCVIPGGISTKVLTASEIAGLTLDSESVESAGSSMGSGGMIAIAEGTCMVRLLQVMLRFYHHESCGQCTPCREGMGWLHRIIDRIVDGQGRKEDLDQMLRISRMNDGTTICGMGDAAGYATVGILAKYRDEFDYWIEHKRSRYDGNLECRPST